MATVNQHSAFKTPAPGATLEMPIGDSSFLAKIKYDPATFQLTVTMKSGAEYVHFQVFPAVIDEFIQAPSKGKFYASQIKGRGPSASVIDKKTGPAIRNMAKGPIQHRHTTRGNHERK